MIVILQFLWLKPLINSSTPANRFESKLNLFIYFTLIYLVPSTLLILLQFRSITFNSLQRIFLRGFVEVMLLFHNQSSSKAGIERSGNCSIVLQLFPPKFKDLRMGNLFSANKVIIVGILDQFKYKQSNLSRTRGSFHSLLILNGF